MRLSKPLILCIFICSYCNFTWSQKTIYTTKDFTTIVSKKKASWKIITVPSLQGDAIWNATIYPAGGKNKNFITATVISDNPVAVKSTWNGNSVWYYKSPDKIEKVGRFLNGQENGMWKEFYENGNLRAKGFYYEGFKKDVWLSYYESGGLMMRNNYDSAGKKDGNCTVFWEFDDTGRRTISNYKSGLKNGMETVYEANSVIDKIAFYLKDSLHGLVKGFYSSGKLKSAENYMDNGLTDTSVFYFESGEIACREIFKTKNKLEKFIWYNRNGDEIKTGTDLNESFNFNGPEIKRAFDSLSYFIRKNFVYPLKALDEGISATIYLRFSLNTHGEARIARIKVDPMSATMLGFENELERLFLLYHNFPKLILHGLEDQRFLVLPVRCNLE